MNIVLYLIYYSSNWLLYSLEVSHVGRCVHGFVVVLKVPPKKIGLHDGWDLYLLP